MDEFLNMNFQDRTCVLFSPTGTDHGEGPRHPPLAEHRGPQSHTIDMLYYL